MIQSFCNGGGGGPNLARGDPGEGTGYHGLVESLQELAAHTEAWSARCLSGVVICVLRLVQSFADMDGKVVCCGPHASLRPLND